MPALFVPTASEQSRNTSKVVGPFFSSELKGLFYITRNLSREETNFFPSIHLSIVAFSIPRNLQLSPSQRDRKLALPPCPSESIVQLAATPIAQFSSIVNSSAKRSRVICGRAAYVFSEFMCFSVLA